MIGDALLDALHRLPATKDARLPDDGATDALVGEVKSVLTDLTRAPKALERATAVWLWEKAWKKPRRGGDHRSEAFKAQPKKNQTHKFSGFDLEAAEQLGVSPSTIRNDRILAELLGRDSICDLWTSPINDHASALKSFAGLSSTHRSNVLALWRDNPKLAFGEACRTVGAKAPADSDKALLATLINTWGRAPTHIRRRFSEHAGYSVDEIERVVRAWMKRGRE